MLKSLSLRGSLRHYRRHRWQTALIIAGIVLGVAVVVAVDLANESARRALRLSIDTVSGHTSHRIHGGPAGIPESVFTALRRDVGIHHSAPLVTDYVRIGDRTFTLLGVDALSEIALRRYGAGIAGADLNRLLTADSVVLPAGAARTLKVETGDSLALAYRGKPHQVTVAAVLHGSEADSADALVLADIATAQVLLERTGSLDRIDLAIDDATAAILARWLPPPLVLVNSVQRDQTLARMTDTFHLNLTAMSLLALLVGALLIHNSATFAILRRRTNWGILRALGGTRSQLLRSILLEALILAAAGTAIGLLTGVLLAQGLVRLVLGPVNDLYFVLTVSQFTLSPLSLAKGSALGLGITLVAALPPALEATATAPAMVLRPGRIETQARNLTPVFAALGLAAMAAGWWLAARDSHSLVLGFVALALLVTGFCALVPGVLYQFVRGTIACLAPVLGPVARLALRGISAGLSRTGLAVAALCVAVAATLGMDIMIASFRQSLDTWLSQTLTGDIYVSTPGNTSQHPGPGLPPEWLASLARLPGVATIERHRTVMVETELGPVRLLALDGIDRIRPDTSQSLPLETAPPGTLARFGKGEGVLVSRPLAYHHSLAPGDRIGVRAASGNRQLEVLGIFTDYRYTRGVIAMHRDLYRRLWRDDGVSSLALHGDGTVPRHRLLAQVREAALQLPRRVEVQSSADIRHRSMAIFERTFAVTNVLRLLTVTVAFVGVLGALMLLQLERLRELGILRACGMTRRQISALVLGQTATMGLFAGLLALPLGLLMANVLIRVINLRAFGWMLTTVTPPLSLAQAVMLALMAALLAGLYPAWRAGRVNPARVLRGE